MYQVGKYKYKSKARYQKILIGVFLIFLGNYFLLQTLQFQMSFWLYTATITVDAMMLIHLPLRYLHSEGKINYALNEL